MDIPTLLLLLQAGAAVAGSTLVEEATRDAYNSVKAKIAGYFKGSGQEALAALEAEPNDQPAIAQLTSELTALSNDDRRTLLPLLTRLQEALRHDAAARELLQQRAHMKLDLDAEGHITIARIQDAGVMDVTAKARGDISITDINFAPPPTRGN